MSNAAERINNLSPEKLAALSRLIKTRAQSGAAVKSSVRRNEMSRYPLSFAQQQLRFINQLEPDSFQHNCPEAIRVKGQLNLPAIEQTFTEIVRRHETLRSTFQVDEGEPVQVVGAITSFSVQSLSLSNLSAGKQSEEVRRLAIEEARRVFDLASGPLFRVTLLELGNDDHVVFLTTHHIVSDAWSMELLISEIGTVYQAFSSGHQSLLADPEFQYGDFSIWQREHLQGERLRTMLDYWKRQLAGPLPELKLPLNYPRPDVRMHNGSAQSIMLSASLTDGMKALASREGATLFMTLLAGFKALLSRYNGQNDIIVGTPFANRNRVETEGLIGCLLNTVALRTNLSGNPTFKELMARVREITLSAQAHVDAPFELVVESVRPDRSTNSTPVFQVWFVLQIAPPETLEGPGLQITPIDFEIGTSQFDLALSLNEVDQGLSAVMIFDTDLFNAATIVRMLEDYELLMRKVVDNPHMKLAAITEMLTEVDRQRWAGTKAKNRFRVGDRKIKSEPITQLS
jgi:NRPS condensation-like uncharacterized protein